MPLDALSKKHQWHVENMVGRNDIKTKIGNANANCNYHQSLHMRMDYEAKHLCIGNFNLLPINQSIKKKRNDRIWCISVKKIWIQYDSKLLKSPPTGVENQSKHEEKIQKTDIIRVSFISIVSSHRAVLGQTWAILQLWCSEIILDKKCPLL